LQRAIGLARSALATAGVDDVICTHARRGYRLAAEAAATETDEWSLVSPDTLAERAWNALFAGKADEALSRLEACVAASQAAGDPSGAAWAALLAGQLRLERREVVLARGWQHRATRLLAGCKPG